MSGAVTRGCDLLDIIMTNMEELVRDMKVGSSLCCGDYEMVEFKIPRGGSKAKGRITGLQKSKLWPVQGPA